MPYAPAQLLCQPGFRFLHIRIFLTQRLTDTLCGTKALFREDYERIAEDRRRRGSLDPFGDFDLIFGASRLNLHMVEIPVRYDARTYGAM